MILLNVRDVFVARQDDRQCDQAAVRTHGVVNFIRRYLLQRAHPVGAVGRRLEQLHNKSSVFDIFTTHLHDCVGFGLSLKLEDLAEGRVIWQATGSRTGWGRASLSATAERVVGELLEDLVIPSNAAR